MTCTLQMCDLETYIGPASEPTIHTDAAQFAYWLKGIVRKHRFVCIGWYRLYKELHGERYDRVVVDTLDAMGLGSPDWDKLLHKEHVEGCGVDERGLFFRNGNHTSSADSSSMWIQELLEHGPAFMSKHSFPVRLQTHSEVTFIGVTGQAPRQLVNWRGR